MFKSFHCIRAAVIALLTLLTVPSHAAPIYIDLSNWSTIQYGRFEQGPAAWMLNGDNTVVTQTKNADPSILLSDFTLVTQQIRGTWRVDDNDDDDFMGFVFGFQDDQHFYLFDWKQTRQAAPARGIAEEGMTIKVVSASSPINRTDFWATYPSNTNRTHTLYHNNIPWKSFTDYEWELDFLPGFFSITVREDGNVLDVIQLAVNVYPTGRFGFYNSSQEAVSYSQFTTEILPPRPALSISDATALEGNNGTSLMTFQATLSQPSQEPVSALVTTRPLSATDRSDYSGLDLSTLQFAPGETNVSVTVPIHADLLHEQDETFSIHLSRLQNAVFGRINGIGTIIDDDIGTNDPPVIEISQPANNTVFNSLAPFTITAQASDPDGTVVAVDFFAGTRFLGRSTTEPFNLSFQPDAIGNLSLTAIATDDDSDTAISLPVLVSVRAGTNADVAIVRNFANPEIDLMRQYLAEMDYTSLVFDQEGLTFDALDEFRVVIWDDLGEVAGGLTDNDVQVLGQLFDNDIALYFIGEHLGSSVANLNELTTHRWRQLTHLIARPVAEGTGFINATPGSHPLSNGPFGTVVGFPHPPTMDPATRAHSGEELIGFSGETDILLAYESPDGLVRSVTQNVLVSRSAPECGLIERKRLFKNTVWWLMQEFPPPRFLNLFADMEQSHDSIIAGLPVTYTITASHSGELGATDTVLVNHLPPGMMFVNATTTQGSWTNQCGVIVCNLGELAYSYEATITITAIPAQSGLMTNIATLSANNPEPRTIDNIVTALLEVLDPGDIQMTLDARLLSPSQLKLQLTAPAGLRYLIESSGNMKDWELCEDFVAADGLSCFTNTVSRLTSRRFYRARLHTP